MNIKSIKKEETPEQLEQYKQQYKQFISCISCTELKNRSEDEKVKYIKLYSDGKILPNLPIDWRSNFYMLLKSIDPTDFDIACTYDDSVIFNSSLELLKIKVTCSAEIEKIARNILNKYVALLASLNDYNQEMAEPLDDFYWNYFLTSTMSDISYIFNSLLYSQYSQKQGNNGGASRIIDMNDTKHIKNSLYLFKQIQKNSSKE